MAVKCSLCGKFRKEKDVFGACGDSDDTGHYQEWVECKFCCSPFDREIYFKDEKKEEAQ